MPVVDLFRDCPGYAEAARRENEIRALPFLGLPETVAGIDCEPLTLRRMMWLQMVKSPFLLNVTVEQLTEKPNIASDLIAFFWIVSPEFSAGNKRQRRKFDKRIEKCGLLKKDAATVLREVKEYIEESFLDAEEGASEKSFYSNAASMGYLCHKMFGLEIDLWENSLLRRIVRKAIGKPNPMDIPLKIIFQFIRSHKNSQNPTIFTNRLSDARVNEWIRGMRESRKN